MGTAARHYKLLDTNTTVAYGPWVPIANALPDSVMLHTVGVVTNDKVQIYLSAEKDPTTAEQVQFGSDITGDGQLEMTSPSRWMRAYRSVITGAGTVTVHASFTELF